MVPPKPPTKRPAARSQPPRKGSGVRSRPLLPGEIPAVRLPRGAGRVLVVDDLRDNREMYSEYLAFHGYVVVEATDGKQAVALAREHQPDVVIMDMSLPELSGWEATRILRESEDTKHVRIIALSGHAEAASRERAIDAGCDIFVAKPCLPHDLLEHVKALVAVRSRPRARRAKKG